MIVVIADDFSGAAELAGLAASRGWNAEVQTSFDANSDAEVIAFDDFIKYKSEAACRDNGKLRIEGKEYLVKDGDVMHFRFNV